MSFKQMRMGKFAGGNLNLHIKPWLLARNTNDLLNICVRNIYNDTSDLLLKRHFQATSSSKFPSASIEKRYKSDASSIESDCRIANNLLTVERRSISRTSRSASRGPNKVIGVKKHLINQLQGMSNTPRCKRNSAQHLVDPFTLTKRPSYKVFGKTSLFSSNSSYSSLRSKNSDSRACQPLLQPTQTTIPSDSIMYNSPLRNFTRCMSFDTGTKYFQSARNQYMNRDTNLTTSTPKPLEANADIVSHLMQIDKNTKSLLSVNRNKSYNRITQPDMLNKKKDPFDGWNHPKIEHVYPSINGEYNNKMTKAVKDIQQTLMDKSQIRLNTQFHNPKPFYDISRRTGLNFSEPFNPTERRYDQRVATSSMYFRPYDGEKLNKKALARTVSSSGGTVSPAIKQMPSSTQGKAAVHTKFGGGAEKVQSATSNTQSSMRVDSMVRRRSLGKVGGYGQQLSWPPAERLDDLYLFKEPKRKQQEQSMKKLAHKMDNAYMTYDEIYFNKQQQQQKQEQQQQLNLERFQELDQEYANRKPSMINYNEPCSKKSALETVTTEALEAAFQDRLAKSMPKSPRLMSTQSIGANKSVGQRKRKHLISPEKSSKKPRLSIDIGTKKKLHVKKHKRQQLHSKQPIKPPQQQQQQEKRAKQQQAPKQQHQSKQKKKRKQHQQKQQFHEKKSNSQRGEHKKDRSNQSVASVVPVACLAPTQRIRNMRKVYGAESAVQQLAHQQQQQQQPVESRLSRQHHFTRLRESF